MRDEKPPSRLFTYQTQLSAIQVLAHVLNFRKRANAATDDLKRSIVENNPHNEELYVCKKSPSPFRNRDFRNRRVWMQMDDCSFLISTMPIVEDDHLANADKVVRGRFPLVMKITPTSDNECSVEYVIQIDFEGTVPAMITNMCVRLS